MRTFLAVFSVLFMAVAAVYAGCGIEKSPGDGGVADTGIPDGGSGTDGGAADSGSDAGAMDGSLKNEPDPSFFDPVSAKNVAMNMKGLINSYQDVLDEKATDGIGSATMSIGGKTVQMAEMTSAFAYTFPMDYPRADWRGETFIIMDLYNTRDAGTDYALYDAIRLYVPVKDLLAAKASGVSIFPFGSMGYLSYTDLKINVRKDNVYLQRTCYEALAEPKIAASKYFVNHGDNTGFEVGENIKIWGNLGVTDDKAVISASISGL